MHETWRAYPPSVLLSLLRPERPARRLCSISGCEGSHEARGWCRRHYVRWRAAGDPLAPARRRVRITRETIARVHAEWPSTRWSAFDWIDEVFASPWRLDRLAASFGRALILHPMTPEHAAGCARCGGTTRAGPP